MIISIVKWLLPSKFLASTHSYRHTNTHTYTLANIHVKKHTATVKHMLVHMNSEKKTYANERKQPTNICIKIDIQIHLHTIAY